MTNGQTETGQFQQAPGEAWDQLRLSGYTPMSIVAATYSFLDRSLWLLDTVLNERAQRSIRLVRVDPFSAPVSSFAVVGEGLLDPKTMYFLSSDKDGALLLTSVTSKGTTLTRITIGDRPQFRVVRFELARLARAPLVDNFGYSFVIRKPDGSISIERHTATEGNCEGVSSPIGSVNPQK